MAVRSLVLDANILIRAVFGKRVRQLIETYAGTVALFVREPAYQEAEEHVPAIIRSRGGDPEKALALLRTFRGIVEILGSDVYGQFETEARKRLGRRDPEDWPILALALAIECPIWTEDADFFGCGVATWITSGVEEFLRQP